MFRCDSSQVCAANVISVLRCIISMLLSSDQDRIIDTVSSVSSHPACSKSTQPSGVGKLEYHPAWLGLRRGALTCVMWQVTQPTKSTNMESSVSSKDSKRLSNMEPFHAD